MPADFLRLSRLLERLHASLTGVTAAQHHAKTTLFTDLTDTPAAYTGEAGKFPKVNVGEDALEFATVAAEVGGLYGINVETLTGDKTLTPNTDKIYQYLADGGAHRIITLATVGATAGNRFIIRHNGTYNVQFKLTIQQAATVLDWIFAGGIKEFIFDGTNWICGGVGAGEDDNKKWNTQVGFKAEAYDYGTSVGFLTVSYGRGVAVGGSSIGREYGVAVGNSAQAYSHGVAIGYLALGYTYGVAVGEGADARSYSVAVGYHADAYRNSIAIGYSASVNGKFYAIALGWNSKCVRDGETTINIDGDATQKNNVVQGRWKGITTDNTPIEILCAGRANARFTIRPSSVLAFTMLIVARDNAANEVARYSVHDGLIKRDGANATVMVLCNVIVDHADDVGWDCAVTADDTNEALIITVTGDAANPVQWAAVLDGVETHF